MPSTNGTQISLGIVEFILAGMDLRAVRRFCCNSPGTRSYRFRTIGQQKAELGPLNHRTARRSVPALSTSLPPNPKVSS